MKTQLQFNTILLFIHILKSNKVKYLYSWKHSFTKKQTTLYTGTLVIIRNVASCYAKSFAKAKNSIPQSSTFSAETSKENVSFFSIPSPRTKLFFISIDTIVTQQFLGYTYDYIYCWMQGGPQ